MSNSTDNQFFDLHITGVGYVNRIRKITPKRGEAFWACDISALNGPANDVEYRRFDCRVSGAKAEKLVKKFAATVRVYCSSIGPKWTATRFMNRHGVTKPHQSISVPRLTIQRRREPVCLPNPPSADRSVPPKRSSDSTSTTSPSGKALASRGCGLTHPLAGRSLPHGRHLSCSIDWRCHVLLFSTSHRSRDI